MGIDELRCPVLNTRRGLRKSTVQGLDDDQLDDDDHVSDCTADEEGESVDEEELSAVYDTLKVSCKVSVHPAASVRLCSERALEKAGEMTGAVWRWRVGRRGAWQNVPHPSRRAIRLHDRVCEREDLRWCESAISLGTAVNRVRENDASCARPLLPATSK